MSDEPDDDELQWTPVKFKMLKSTEERLWTVSARNGLSFNDALNRAVSIYDGVSSLKPGQVLRFLPEDLESGKVIGRLPVRIPSPPGVQWVFVIYGLFLLVAGAVCGAVAGAGIANGDWVIVILAALMLTALAAASIEVNHRGPTVVWYTDTGTDDADEG